MKGYVPPDKLVVRDSLDDEISDDVEDDVFIRDGRSNSMCEERGLKRPLMAPRRKNGARYKKSLAFMKKRHRFWSCCEPFCYGLAAITIIIGISPNIHTNHKEPKKKKKEKIPFPSSKIKNNPYQNYHSPSK